MPTLTVHVELDDGVLTRLQTVLQEFDTALEVVVRELAIEIAESGQMPEGFVHPSQDLSEAMREARSPRNGEHKAA